jgi:signal transduction histidine kinase/ligand-binding sensor domain-containing protein
MRMVYGWKFLARIFLIAQCVVFFVDGAQAQVGGEEIPAALSTRTVSPRFERLGIEDGLSQGSVYDIFQDSRGFMWFTTQDGLNRYDGYTVKSFTHEPFDNTSLSPGFSMGIAEGKDAELWIASFSGLNRLDPLTEKITVYNNVPENPQSISTGSTWGVLADSKRRLWIGTNGEGLERMDLDNPGVFEHYPYDEEDESGVCDRVVYNIFESSSGDIWLATKNGICRVDPANPGRFDSRMADGPRPRARSGFQGSDYEVYDILERPQEPGVFWLGTVRGLVRIDTETGDSERFLIDPDPTSTGVRPNLVWRLTQDPTNPSILWIPTNGLGLARFDVRAKRFILFRADEDNPTGLATNTNYSAYTDRSGVVWIGSSVTGVSRFNPSSVGMAHYRPGDLSDPLSLPGPSVWEIYESRDDVLWIGSQDNERQYWLTALDRENGVSRHFRHDPNDPGSRDPGSPNTVYEDANGNLWVASNLGIDLLDRSTGRFRHFRADPVDPGSIPGAAKSMLTDRAGGLWVGTSRGLAKMRAGELGRFDRFMHDPDDSETIVTTVVHSLIEDLAGFLWLAGDGGLSRFDPETGKAIRFVHDPDDPSTLGSSHLYVVHERKREPGILWLGSAGGGLDRLDVQSRAIRHFTVRDGLPNNTVYGILEDDQGRLWLSTNHGLARFDPDTETFKNYGLEVGLQSLEFSEDAYYKCRHGEFFLGGGNGLNAFFPNELSENQNAPDVRLIDLKLFNESVTSTGAIALDKPISEVEEIELDYSQREVTFDFVAFHYADPAGNEYAYKLEGFNDDWVYIGAQRTASFTNLAPGEYTFRMKAANSDGVWNEEGSSVRVVVNPPFWMTWWFRVFSLVGLVGVVYGGYRLRTAQLEARARGLESMVETRTIQLKESNDQLEQSQSIVEAINRETSLTRVLTKFLEEARVIPGVEKATAIVFMPFEDRFVVRASSGWDVEAMRDIRLTRPQAHERYIEQAEEVADDVFVAKGVRVRAGADQMAEFGEVASFLVLRVRVENDVVAYLVFDNLTDENAFDQRDAELLERLREHITSAFIKSRILEDLQSERTNLQEALDELRATQDRLIQSEKMASLGQLTAGIAHEIKNPLNFVNNFSDLSKELAEELSQQITSRRSEISDELAAEIEDILAGLRTNVEKIHEHGKRADSIVYGMLQHSRTGEAQREEVVVNTLVEEHLNLAYHGVRARAPDFNATLETHYGQSVGTVEAVPQDLGRVLLNLIGNAFDALLEARERNAGEAGAVGPKVTVSTTRKDGSVEIRISDNGPGIPDDVKSRIFEPFFTTKPTGSGTGLGLSMSYDIVTKGHGGELDVVSEPGKGATFIVRLPA